MAEKRTLAAEQQKKSVAEQMWLRYFNQTLYEKGLITETERNRIKNMIDSRRSSPMT